MAIINNINAVAYDHREPDSSGRRSPDTRSTASSHSSRSSAGRNRRGGRGGKNKRSGGPGKSPKSPNANSTNQQQTKRADAKIPASCLQAATKKGAALPSAQHLAKYQGVKTPFDQPMGKKDMYFALDCEMVGVGSDGSESALARVVIVNYDEEIVLDKFVRVEQPVIDYRTFVSGITAEDLQSPDAISHKDCRRLVREVLHGKILIGHGLASDLAAIGITHPWSDIRDSAKYAPYMRRVRSQDTGLEVLMPSKLRDLVWDKCQMQIQVQGSSHNPTEDALAALNLYKASRKDWEMGIIRQMKEAREYEDASVRRAEKHKARALRHHNQQQRYQQKKQTQHRGAVMTAFALANPTPAYYNNNYNNPYVQQIGDMTMKPSIQSLHQIHPANLSPQMMPTQAPTDCIPPIGAPMLLNQEQVKYQQSIYQANLSPQNVGYQPLMMGANEYNMPSYQQEHVVHSIQNMVS